MLYASSDLERRHGDGRNDLVCHLWLEVETEVVLAVGADLGLEWRRQWRGVAVGEGVS
jgi:hypothetical protein